MENLAIATLAPLAAADSPQRRRTPGLLLGPYYPLDQPATAGGELWRGSALPAGARCLRLEGQVLDQGSTPVECATVELWHADPAGRYRHPSAPQADHVLEGFAGYGRVVTAADGRFTFQSLVPGSYEDGDVLRAPHLHLQITGHDDRLITQVFLPGHPGNAADRWYQAVARPERLLAEVLSDDARGLHLWWSAVLSRG
jgi:protocatechuate 3,4-dioxygenase beta subunit